MIYNLQGDQETFSWYLHSAGGGQLNKKWRLFQGSLNNQIKKLRLWVLRQRHSLVLGSQLLNTGTTKDRESAKEYFQNVNKVSKECGLTTLLLDRNTDIRE